MVLSSSSSLNYHAPSVTSGIPKDHNYSFAMSGLNSGVRTSSHLQLKHSKNELHFTQMLIDNRYTSPLNICPAWRCKLTQNRLNFKGWCSRLKHDFYWLKKTYYDLLWTIFLTHERMHISHPSLSYIYVLVSLESSATPLAQVPWIFWLQLLFEQQHIQFIYIADAAQTN